MSELEREVLSLRTDRAVVEVRQDERAVAAELVSLREVRCAVLCCAALPVCGGKRQGAWRTFGLFVFFKSFLSSPFCISRLRVDR